MFENHFYMIYISNFLFLKIYSSELNKWESDGSTSAEYEGCGKISQSSPDFFVPRSLALSWWTIIRAFIHNSWQFSDWVLIYRSISSQLRSELIVWIGFSHQTLSCDKTGLRCWFIFFVTTIVFYFSFIFLQFWSNISEPYIAE